MGVVEWFKRLLTAMEASYLVHVILRVAIARKQKQTLPHPGLVVPAGDPFCDKIKAWIEIT